LPPPYYYVGGADQLLIRYAYHHYGY